MKCYSKLYGENMKTLKQRIMSYTVRVDCPICSPLRKDTIAKFGFDTKDLSCSKTLKKFEPRYFDIKLINVSKFTTVTGKQFIILFVDAGEGLHNYMKLFSLKAKLAFISAPSRLNISAW